MDDEDVEKNITMRNSRDKFQYTKLLPSAISSTESDPLLQNYHTKRFDRPRMSSIFFMVDSWFAGGIVTRANYMAQCYNTVWCENSGSPCLRYLYPAIVHSLLFAKYGVNMGSE